MTNGKHNLEGQRFNKWLVSHKVSATVIRKGKEEKIIKWWCKCDCGTEKSVHTYDLLGGYSKSCAKCCAIKPYKGLPDPMWRMIEKRAISKNFEFNITKEYIYSLFLEQGKKCALSDIEIYFPYKGTDLNFPERWTASLDRIDSRKGYIIGNVQWLHKHVNRIKNVFPEEYFISICKKIAEKQKDKIHPEIIVKSCKK